jgi:Putative zinc-finger
VTALSIAEYVGLQLSDKKSTKMTINHTEAEQTLAAERYLLGDMSRPEVEEFEEHLFACQECAEAVKAGAVFTDNARAVFEEQAVRPVADEAKARERRAAPWWTRITFPMLAPTFAALTLLCLAGYQRLVVIPQLRDQLAAATAPQTFPSFGLHGVFRGDRQVVKVPPSAQQFSLYFDAAISSVSGYSCDLLDASGAIRFKIAVEQPKPGEVVNLLLNRSKVPAGDYTLIVRTGPPDAREVGQYQFRIEYQ